MHVHLITIKVSIVWGGYTTLNRQNNQYCWTWGKMKMKITLKCTKLYFYSLTGLWHNEKLQVKWCLGRNWKVRIVINLRFNLKVDQGKIFTLWPIIDILCSVGWRLKIITSSSLMCRSTWKFRGKFIGCEHTLDRCSLQKVQIHLPFVLTTASPYGGWVPGPKKRSTTPMADNPYNPAMSPSHTHACTHRHAHLWFEYEPLFTHSLLQVYQH